MKRFFKPGQTILFQGDSITDCGRWYYENQFGFGYAWKVASVYNSLFADEAVSFENRDRPEEPNPAYPPVFADSGVRFVNKGWAGNCVQDILDRYQTDIFEIKPDFMSLLVGVNEILHFHEGTAAQVPPQQFAEQYETLLSRFRSDFPKAGLMIMEPFFIPSVPEYAEREKDLNEFLPIVRDLAYRYADYYLPLGGILAAAQMQLRPEQLAKDGIHPTPLCHGIIAEAYLRQLGIL